MSLLQKGDTVGFVATSSGLNGKKIDFGIIHHMYEDEEGSRVLLDKRSFTSHVFVTGSTGSGKSNSVYQLIEKMCLELNEETEKTNTMFLLN